MASKVTCSSCGWSWNKSDSSKKDLYVCHQCGKDNTMKDGGWLNKFEDTPDAQNGIEGTMGGLTDIGFDYNGAWGGTMQMGGSLPGSVGFTYARTQSPAPSNGPYAKKTKASAQFGEKVKPNDKRSQKFYNQLEQYYTRPDATQVEKATYKAFQQLNEQYGYAPVALKNKTIAGKRSMINPLTGRLNLVVQENEPIGEIKPEAKRMMEEYMNEYGHYQQYNEHPEYSKLRKAGNFLGDLTGDFGHMLKNLKGLRFAKAYNENYNTPGTTENEAHSIIQPKLQQELDENMLKNLDSRSRMPQLQNGQEMKFYQEGLDWKPKNISKNGAWLDKFQDGTPGSGLSPVSIDKSITLPEVVIQDGIPKRIQEQSKIILEKKPKKNYSIVDKGKNLIYYYDPTGELITTEQIITGASNKDSDVAPSMRNYFEKNDTSNHEEYFNYLSNNQLQTTPSGMFTISGMRENTAQNPDKIGSFFNKTFRPEREKEIEDIRLQDYGEQQKLLTLMSEYGVPSSKAIHGTGREERLAAFEKGDPDGRNLSNGCINVNGETVCFDLLSPGSNVAILPEENDDLLYYSNINKNKNKYKNYANTKKQIADSLITRGIKPTQDAINFISSIAEKESKNTRSVESDVVEKALPFLFKSKGAFQINPNSKEFNEFLPSDYDPSNYESGVEAVYNFYDKYKDLGAEEMYNKYRGGANKRINNKFNQIYKDIQGVYKDGGWLNKYEEGRIIEDDMGQWAHPGEITKINSNQITMQGVDYPVLGISDTGDTKMMKPGKDYKFKGKSVTELPMMQGGGDVIKVKQPDGSFKTYNTNSEEYRKLYDSGNLMNYDKSTDTYFAKPLDEVVITGQAPEKGFWEQYRDDLTRKHNSGILDAVLGTPIDAVFGLPQRAMMYGLTGKVQDPSEALGIENPYGALAVNVLGDPLNAFGLGLTDDALRLTGKASQGLREVGQYLPARGEVISELKDLKRAAFPTKPTFINPSEQELLSTIRNVGLLSKTGAKDADILEKVLAKSSRLTDDEFKNLVGSTRSELKGKIQALRETPKGAKKVGENQFEWDVNPNANQSSPPILDANGNPISTSGNINLNRPARSQAARDAASTRRQGRQLQNLYDQVVAEQGGRDLSPQQMNILQTFVDDTYQLIRTDPDNAPNFSDFTNPAMMDLYNFKLEPNKSFIRGLTNRINEGRYLPQSYEQADAVLPNLYRDETNNPIAEMFKAMRIVERSPKGSTLKSAGSLSTDSYPATLRLSERLRDKGIVDINYTGMSSLNPSGFSQTAGIPTNINLKEMNTLIDQLNKTLPKPLPFGYIEGNYMKVPQISVTRKKNGGWLNKYE